MILRWAKALKYYAENASIYIDENQLIVGRSGKPGRYGILYPELDGDTLDEAIKTLPSRDVSPLILLRKMRRSLQSRSHLTGKGRRFMRILQKHFRGKQKNLLIMEIKS